MRSDAMKKGVQRIPHRALFKALGLTDEELSRPIIGVVCSSNEIIPGHAHLDTVAEAVKAGVRMAGGTPIEFPSIGVYLMGASGSPAGLNPDVFMAGPLMRVKSSWQRSLISTTWSLPVFRFAPLQSASACPTP